MTRTRWAIAGLGLWKSQACDFFPSLVKKKKKKQIGYLLPINVFDPIQISDVGYAAVNDEHFVIDYGAEWKPSIDDINHPQQFFSVFLVFGFDLTNETVPAKTFYSKLISRNLSGKPGYSDKLRICQDCRKLDVILNYCSIKLCYKNSPTARYT